MKLIRHFGRFLANHLTPAVSWNEREYFLLSLIALVAFAAGCGGGEKTTSSRSASPQPTNTARPTSGPSASIDPRSGPAGTQVTVNGSGWAPRAAITVTAASSATSARPYASVTASDDGSFSARFRLEKGPDGSDLKVGRFDIVARAGGAEVTLPFQVEVARPVRNPGDGGG